MPQIPSLPNGNGMACEIRGFDNVPDKASDRMPVQGSKPTPIEDRVMEDSNTDRVPVGAIPGGSITAQEAWAAKGSTSGRPR